MSVERPQHTREPAEGSDEDVEVTRAQYVRGPELLLRPGPIAKQRMLIRGSGPPFFVSYVLRAD